MNGLAARSIVGFAQLIIVLGFTIFAAAGTFDYWQGWAFACAFIACAALVTAYLWKFDPKLLARRVKAGPGAERDPIQNVIQGIASVAFIAIIAVPGLDRRFGWTHVPAAVAILGDVLVVLGFAVVFYVFRENSFTAATIGVAADQRVVTTGPYAIVRHPMYAGALVMLFGTPLALGSWWGLFAFVPMTLVIVWWLLEEEQFLAKHLAGYPEYCAMVRFALVPFVW
jgi:protein-S-isoprenylcysteine O-methyltransferase Ste14